MLRRKVHGKPEALAASSTALKASANDADRLRKYLARFGLSWAEIP